MDNKVSVILNVYKRPYSLEKQIEAIKNQTIKINSEDIHIWYNTPEDETKHFLPKDKKIKTYQCNYNTKFYGRFTIPLLCRTPYIAMFDDDIICGKEWIKNCIQVSEKHNAILGGSGVELKGSAYLPNKKYGWSGVNNENITEVDLVGHAWFFKQDLAKFMWLETPPSWDNGEDMFFSYVAQKYGIPTLVPPHPKNNIEMWSNVPTRDNNMGVDNAASSIVNKNHLGDRNKIVLQLKQRGWKPLNIRDDK